MKIVAGIVLAAAMPAIAAADCKLEDIAGGSVIAARDGRTLALSDGREIRLAGIEAGNDNAALDALSRSRMLTLKKIPGGASDRYGRVLAFAYLDNERSVQQALLAAGQARVAARTGGVDCAAPLLAAERAAREARAGLWADAASNPIDAETPSKIATLAGRFALVEGKVLTVRESGALIYVNFGRRWSRDFTLTILRRNQRLFLAAGMEPKSLAGRQLRVRGIVEMRGGPVIEAEAPEQIEIIQ